MRYVGTTLAVTSVLAIIVSASSCASTPSHFTSLDSSKVISSLSPVERRQYCDDQFRYMTARVSKDDRKKVNCSQAASAVGTGGESDTARARNACQAVFKACTSVPAEDPENTCDGFSKVAEGCSATVGELVACAEAQAEALEEAASKAEDACNHIARSRARSAAAKLPEACARVQALCPKVLGEPALGIGPLL
jgi:hypothetical protein